MYEPYTHETYVWAKEYITIDLGKEIRVGAVMVSAKQTGSSGSFNYKLFKTSYGEILDEYKHGWDEVVRNQLLYIFSMSIQYFLIIG